MPTRLIKELLEVDMSEASCEANRLWVTRCKIGWSMSPYGDKHQFSRQWCLVDNALCVAHRSSVIAVIDSTFIDGEYCHSYLHIILYMKQMFIDGAYQPWRTPLSVDDTLGSVTCDGRTCSLHLPHDSI